MAGIPGKRRLARAFNAASSAFLQVEARATHDRLTGISNRETLLTTLGAEVDRAVRHYKPLSVVFIDGGGYPHGLKGNEIPLGARIVSVADAYHAMVHDRPYSAAQSHEEALAELQRNAGTQFDPDVVNVFCDIYAASVPPDGLEEVYRLHQRARDGVSYLNVTPHAHPHAAARAI
ncbi:hypothetical protein BH24CHL10_BH24CHL10_00300 [soil metagenome]